MKPALSIRTPVLRTQQPLGWHGVLGREVAAPIAVAGKGTAAVGAAVGAAVARLVAAADAPADATAANPTASAIGFGGGLLAMPLAVVTGGRER